MIRRRPTLALLLTATACVPAAPPPPAPPPAPAPVAPPAPAPLASDWRDWPLTPGTWSYDRGPGGSFARFGPSAQSLFVIDCEPNRKVMLLRPNFSPGPMTIRTSSVTRSIVGETYGHPVVGNAATIVATDPLLDAIAFSRGRFIVEQSSSPPLVIPTYAEIGRVIEDCRG